MRSSVDGHLGCVPIPANINNAPVNIFAANLKGIFLISSFYKLTEVKLLIQRECADYLLKISEMSNMVQDAVLKGI